MVLDCNRAVIFEISKYLLVTAFLCIFFKWMVTIFGLEFLLKRYKLLYTEERFLKL